MPGRDLPIFLGLHDPILAASAWQGWRPHRRQIRLARPEPASGEG